MSPLTEKGVQLYERYDAAYSDWCDSAAAAQTSVERILDRYNFDLHLIGARAKCPLSLLQKLRAKTYSDPDVQVTDRIGVRVITYYENDIDPVVRALKDELVIDPDESVDKREDLSLREFGYRSVHLIARVPLTGLEDEPTKRLGIHSFEIQVRSILEHAWAEIEHELVYKAGISHEDEFRREFSRLAANLEGVDKRFETLRAERNKLIERYYRRYDERRDMEEPLDAARVLGFLESVRPEALSFRTAEREGRPFPPRVEAVCCGALRQAGLSTAGALLEHLGSRGFTRLLMDFASRRGIAPNEVSHLAVLKIAIGSRDPRLLRDEFPDLLDDVVLRELLPS